MRRLFDLWEASSLQVKQTMGLFVFAVAGMGAYWMHSQSYTAPQATDVVQGSEILLSQKHLSNVMFSGLILRMKVSRLDGLVIKLESQDGLQFTCYIAEDAMPSEGLRAGQRVSLVGSSMGQGAMMVNRPGSVTILEAKPTIMVAYNVVVKNGIGTYLAMDVLDRKKANVPDGVYSKLYLVHTADGGVLEPW